MTTHEREERPEWRPCPEFASAELIDAKYRACRAIPAPDMILVRAETCAACPLPKDRPDAELWRACGEKLVEAAELALPILECEEARHDILLKCTKIEGATEQQHRDREKHLRGKRKEAHRARKAAEAALAAIEEAKP